MTDKNAAKKPEHEPTVGDHTRVARRPDGSQYLVNVSGSPDLPEGFRTELEGPDDVLLPPTVTP